MRKKLLVIVVDGVPWDNWSLFGNLEGWVDAGEARKWKMRSVLPSTSASCYASIHTGVSPAVHGVTGNDNVFRVNMPDVFSALRQADQVTGAVTHSYWSEFFNRAPFDPVRDLEYDEPDSTSINHGRFHTMSGYGMLNQMTPSDADLFATLTMLTERYKLDYGILHTCTLDCMGHRFRHECYEMDNAIFHLDEKLAQYITRWRNAGYEVMVTADHGQSLRGHHGGRGADQQDFALYYFGDAEGVEGDQLLDQRQLAPTVISLMGADVPDTMTFEPFLRNS
jgi:predicted AlkP superfamily pyrophosphatase or phosphodiesterase